MREKGWIRSTKKIKHKGRLAESLLGPKEASEKERNPDTNSWRHESSLKGRKTELHKVR